MKNLIKKANEMGAKGFVDGLKNAPALNIQFMEWIKKDYNSWDEKLMKIRVKLYKEYIKGWVIAHVKSMVIE